MKIYKFVIPSRGFVQDPENPELQYYGIVAATVAETEEAARERLTEYAAMNGHDARWLRVAKVVELPIMPGVVVTWAEV